MMKHKTLQFHLIACLQLAVLALHNVIVAITQISEYQSAVRQPADFYHTAFPEVGRAKLAIRRLEIRVSHSLYLRQFVPMLIS